MAPEAQQHAKRTGRGKRPAGEALSETEERLRIVADCTCDWEYWRGNDNHFLYVSPSCERITGYSREEFIRDPDLYLSIVHPDDRERIATHLREDLHDQDTYELEFRIVRRDGQERWIAHACRPAPGTGNAPGGRRASNRDITERKQAEAALRKMNDELEERVAEQISEIRRQNRVLEAEHQRLHNVLHSLEASNELLERIFDDTHLAIAYLDPSFNFIRVNRTYAAMSRKDPDYFVGKNHFALYPHAENEVIFRRVAETGEPYEVMEKPFEYPDQPERGTTWWDWSLQAVRDKHGRVEGLLLCLLDVSRRVLARQNLVASERKYRELVENANSIIMRLTPEHKITFFNEHAQQFFGFSDDEVLGRNVVGTIVPETDSEGRDLREMVREVTAHLDLHANNENENICKDGRRVWVHWANKAVRDEEENIIEILCVGTDITRRREVEAEILRDQQRLRDLAERLATVEEEERWRISRYIHDVIVQNLSLSSIHLGSILDSASLEDESTKLHKVRAMIEQSIEECRMLMSDLTPSLLYEMGLVPALHDLAQQLAEKHEAQIVIEDDGRDQPMSHPLRGFLFASARELIMNALKHAGPCEIRAITGCSDNDLTIRVTDNGKGFDAPRSTAHPDRHGGFGLFNIHQRVEGMGGRLDIESAPGQGTSTTIRIPLTAPGFQLQTP